MLWILLLLLNHPHLYTACRLILDSAGNVTC